VDKVTVQQQLPGLLTSLRHLQPKAGNRNNSIFNSNRSTLMSIGRALNASSGQHGEGGDDGEVVWLTAVGALQECVGSAALYASLDQRYE
jgi:hypothetical protein